MTSGPVQKLECTMPSRDDILSLPIDKRDAHVNAARWRERAWQDPVSYTHLTLPTICSV